MKTLLLDERAEDIVEYAALLAILLLVVLGTIQFIGGNSNAVFSNVSSSLTP